VIGRALANLESAPDAPFRFHQVGRSPSVVPGHPRCGDDPSLLTERHHHREMHPAHPGGIVGDARSVRPDR
jgi:hypothetical protein